MRVPRARRGAPAGAQGAPRLQELQARGQRAGAVERELRHIGQADLQRAHARPECAKVVVPAGRADVQHAVRRVLQPAEQLAERGLQV